MNKLLVAAVLFSAVAAITAVQLKKDDTPELKEHVEKVASGKLTGFVAAAELGDHPSLRSMADDMIEELEKAKENNGKVLPTIRKACAGILEKAERAKSSFLKRKELQAIVALIDGNRDNISYWAYEGAIQWINRRLPHVDGPARAKLELARDLAVEAQSTLDTKAHVFVNGVKYIREQLKSDNPNYDQIEATARNMVDTFKPTTLEDLTDSALTRAYTAAANL